jgi:hypothetical protein
MRNPHSQRPLLQISGYLLKYFCIGLLGFLVALLGFGMFGGSAFILSIIDFMLPILRKIVVFIFCLIGLGVFWESIR